MGWLLLIVAAAVLLWFLGQRGTTKVVATAGNIRGAGDFDCVVVGSSNYQRHLIQIAGPKKHDAAELKVAATLVLENDNPHDKNAVRVYIDGLTVGYLDREMARSFRKQLRKQGLPAANFTCAAMVIGGWDRGGSDTGHYGVRLDIPIEEE